MFFRCFVCFVDILQNTRKTPQNTRKTSQNTRKTPTKHHKTQLQLLTKQPEFANKPALARVGGGAAHWAISAQRPPQQGGTPPYHHKNAI